MDIKHLAVVYQTSCHCWKFWCYYRI